MDRSDFYYKQNVTQAEMDQAFDDCENAIDNRTIDRGLVGIVSGLEIHERTVPDLWITIEDGVAYNVDGKRIPVTGGDFLLSGQIPSTPGESRYVRYVAVRQVALSDPRTDGDGLPVDYRQEDSYSIAFISGSAGVSPSKPGTSAATVSIGVVLLYNGMTSIVDNDIHTDWDDDPSDPDREIASIIRPGIVNDAAALGSAKPQVNSQWQDIDFGSDVRLLGMAVLGTASGSPGDQRITSNGGDIQTAGGNVEMAGGDVDVDSGRVIKAASVSALEDDPASDEGFLYKDAAGALVIVTKHYAIDACDMLPAGPNPTTDPWSGPGANDWYTSEDAQYGSPGPNVLGGMGWQMNFGAGSGPIGTKGLYIPVHVPDGAKLIDAQVGYRVISAPSTTHFLRLWLLRRSAQGHIIDMIGSANPPANERNGAAGNYTFSESYTSGAQNIVNNSLYRYYLAIQHFHSGAGAMVPPQEDVYIVRTATVEYQIRSAVGVF